MPVNTRFYKKNKNNSSKQNNESHDTHIGKSSRSGGYFGSGGESPKIHDDVKLFHGPIKFKLFGLQIYVSTARQIGFVAVFVAFVVMLFSMYASFSGLNYYKEQISIYESKIEAINERDKVYKELVENAKANIEDDEYYIGDGYFYSNPKNESSSKVYAAYNAYYIIYYIEKEASKFEFSTPVIYASITEISNLSSEIGIGKRSFSVVYKLNENGEIVDSIVANYGDETVNYEKNHYIAEMEELKPTLKVSKVSFGIMIALTAGVLVGIIALIVKTIKKSKSLSIIERAKQEAELIAAKTEVAIAEEKYKLAQDEINRKYRYCQYCGLKFPEDSEKCSNCGSTHYFIKRK